MAPTPGWHTRWPWRRRTSCSPAMKTTGYATCSTTRTGSRRLPAIWTSGWASELLHQAACRHFDHFFHAIAAHAINPIVHVDGGAHVIGDDTQALPNPRRIRAAADIEMAVLLREADQIDIGCTDYIPEASAITNKQRIGREGLRAAIHHGAVGYGVAHHRY